MFAKLKSLVLATVVSLTFCFTANAGKTISLLTCGAGEELYSVFGHSALMVSDDESGKSDIYNFGMFDFNTPHFYFKFIRGNLDYYLDTETEKWFMYVYNEEERTVKAQKLNLSDNETERILSSLDTLMLPQNRAYKYRFAKNNCTTALRDLILNNVDYDKIPLTELTGFTYRDYLNDCLYGLPWTKLGINLIMGAHADHQTTVYESLFLPDIFMNGLARITTPNGLLATPIQNLNSIPDTTTESPATGYYIMYAIFGALAAFALINKSRYPAAVFFYFLGALGCVLLFISSVSLHEELMLNFNILWCNPLFLVTAAAVSMPARLGKKRLVIFVSASGLIMCCITAMIIIWATGVQAFEPVFAIMTMTAIFFLFRTAHSLGATSGFRNIRQNNLTYKKVAADK